MNRVNIGNDDAGAKIQSKHYKEISLIFDVMGNATSNDKPITHSAPEASAVILQDVATALCNLAIVSPNRRVLSEPKNKNKQAQIELWAIFNVHDDEVKKKEFKEELVKILIC